MFDEKFKRKLNIKKEQGLYRDPVIIENRFGKFAQINGAMILSFASNDYLGISELDISKDIVGRNFKKYGTSSSSSRLVSGNYSIINQAEDEYASYFGFESAIFYPSGYQANLGLLSSLFDSSDSVFFDKHIHASAVKGLEGSKAKLTSYNHSSFSHLEKRLSKNDAQNKAVVTESLFSMDGDILDVGILNVLKQKYNFLSIVDESHAFGVLGDKGKGVAKGVSDVAVGTFGKAFGLFGAFVLLPSLIKEYLLNFSSPLIYSTTLPEAHAASALEFLEIIENSDERRDHLKRMCTLLKAELTKAGFKVEGDAHIISIFVGDEERATQISSMMLKSGLLIFPARYPTVHKGKAILRIGMTALHNEEDLEKLIAELKRSFDKCNVSIM
ncbi:MAG: pyridoxal phosphate-dependent aminotransferase family protein [Desulfobacterales bacterium]|nr:pyridoxal phosphate-dependent aminotransferase family protein [Desulfobacterales bacterium]